MELFPKPKTSGQGLDEDEDVLDSQDVVADLWAF